MAKKEKVQAKSSRKESQDQATTRSTKHKKSIDKKDEVMEVDEVHKNGNSAVESGVVVGDETTDESLTVKQKKLNANLLSKAIKKMRAKILASLDKKQVVSAVKALKDY